MIEIAERSGVKRRAIYQKHFKNSKEIVVYLRQLTNTKIFDLFQKYAPLPERILLIILRIIYFPYIKNRNSSAVSIQQQLTLSGVLIFAILIWNESAKITTQRVSGTTFRIRL